MKKSGNSNKSVIIKSLIITIVFAIVYFYLKIPAINPHSGEFWSFFIVCVVVFTACTLLFKRYIPREPKEIYYYVRENLKVPFFIVAGIIAVCIVGSLVGWVLFRSASYSKLLVAESADFSEDIDEVSWDQIPMLDADSANNLANRKLGELSDLVSQFTVNTNSSQINYKNAPVRTAYLDYGGFFKWINNVSDGIPAYMIIDMRTQEVTVKRLESGIKYSPSEYFFRDLMRSLRFKYPTAIFDNVDFEIDDDGTPYWVASVVTKTIGLFSGTNVKGAVLMNAVTGESTYYDVDDVPTWVDRVYAADLIVEQYNYYGRYHNGFWNSIFGQTDCTETTSGYNYIAKDDDVWMYTGVTSVTGDRGNIGFLLVNQRTKEAKYYSCAGAEENSAMSSAEGAVQQYSYSATFPLLLNISDNPTYFMALKDAAGLVKQYAMVNVEQYQIVATGTSLSNCLANYKELLFENEIIDEEEYMEGEGGTDDENSDDGNETAGETSDNGDEDEKETEPEALGELIEITGVVEEIRSASIDGDTIFYFKLDSDPDHYFTVNAADYPEAVIVDVGAEVSLEYREGDGVLLEAAMK